MYSYIAFIPDGSHCINWIEKHFYVFREEIKTSRKCFLLCRFPHDYYRMVRIYIPRFYCLDVWVILTIQTVYFNYIRLQLDTARHWTHP